MYELYDNFTSMQNFNLTPEQQIMLRLEHKRAKKASASLAYRINAILLLGTGWTLEQVSNALLLDIETLRSYVQKFQEGGVKKLLEKNYSGKQRFLTQDQTVQLVNHLESNLYRMTLSVILFVKKEFNILYSRSGMTKLLHELGFTYKKPKLLPSGINFQAQEDFIAFFEHHIEKKHENDPVLFYDSRHPQYQSHADYGWIKKGEDVLLPNHGMRGHVNISGSVDVERGDVIVDFPEKVNAKSTVKTLKKIESYYPEAQTISLILDNAAAHRSRWVKNYVGNSKIKLVYLPPYSPNLNLMERVWGLLRKNLLGNTFNETYADFKNSIKTFFNKTLRAKKEEWLLPLITDEFQCFNGRLIC
jgi:transposase